MVEKTRVVLFGIASQLGFSRADMLRILRANGFSGEFDPNRFDEYMDVLKKAYLAQSRIRERISASPSPAVDFECCPICGGELEWKDETDHYWNRLSKADRWRCKAGAGHWASWRYGRQMKLDMERRSAWYDRITGAGVYSGRGGVRGSESEGPSEMDGSGI